MKIFASWLPPAFGILSGLTACAQSPTADTTSQTNARPASEAVYVSLTPLAFDTKLTQLADEQLIDVRTATEYQAGHLSDALLIDFRGEHFDQELARLDKNRPVMVYCAKGGRSTAAVTRLKKRGFREVYELKGGLSDWIEAGKTITP